MKGNNTNSEDTVSQLSEIIDELIDDDEAYILIVAKNETGEDDELKLGIHLAATTGFDLGIICIRKALETFLKMGRDQS